MKPLAGYRNSKLDKKIYNSSFCGKATFLDTHPPLYETAADPLQSFLLHTKEAKADRWIPPGLFDIS